MLAVDLVRGILGFSALILGLFGLGWCLDPLLKDSRTGLVLLSLCIIALILMFNI